MGANYFHIAAMAGAGCGKTYSLVENYLYALLGLDDSGVKKRPQEILALTFTEKAASEMRLRITKRLQSLVADPYGDEVLLARAHFLSVSLPDKDELQRILRALPTATIATFHSFCSQILRREAAACKLDDRFAILAPKDEIFMAQNLLRPIIVAEVMRNNRSIRSLVARMGLSANMSSLGLLDGLLDIYLKLFEKNIDGDELARILARPAVSYDTLWTSFGDIENALAQFSSTKLSDSTRRRLEHAAYLLPALRTALELGGEAEIARAWVPVRRAVGGNFGDAVLRKNLVAAIANLGNRLVDYFVHDEERAVLDVLSNFHRTFVAHKLDARALSYSDLLEKTKAALINDHALRTRVKSRTKHVLVDEYQDTSPIQQDIIALIAEDRNDVAQFSSHASAIDEINFANGPSLFVVGDKKQSIYGFRGASVALFDRMVEKMADTHRQTDNFTKRLLTINRRSKPRVIDVVNLVARHTMSAQGYRDDQALLPMPEKRDGRAALWVLAHDDKLDKAAANAAAAVYGITRLVTEREDVKARDIVVLVRRIKSASVIKSMLANFGIDARIIGGDGFFEQQEIADMVAALKLINEPGNQFACGVVMRSPLVLLRDHEIMACAVKNELTMAGLTASALQGQLSADSHQRFDRFKNALANAASVVEKDGLVSVLDVLVDGCDAAYSYALHDHGQQLWANIKKLRTKLLLSTSNPYVVIDELYDELFGRSKDSQAEMEGDGDAVTIMTIHQSKGLEFPIVVLADGESAAMTNFGDFLVTKEGGLAIRPRARAIASCAANDNDDVVPTRYEHMRREQKRREDEEVARLLYVALTRARDEIYVATSRASFEAKTLPHNLVGLFLAAHRAAPTEFLACCDIVAQTPCPARVHEPNVVVHDEQVAHVIDDGMTRLFASGLTPHADAGIGDLITRPPSIQFRNVNGDAAHKILSWLCPLLHREINAEALDYLVDAAMRAKSISEQSSDTLLAVKATAWALMNQFAGSSSTPRIISELPLCFMATPTIMIEGFADLVVMSDNDIGVIEFKSSYRRVTDEGTYAQVLAYAEALSRQSNKPVRYAAILVGASSWQWQDYDEKTRQIFARAILA